MKSLRRDERVYYFNHRHGVLKKKAWSRYTVMSGVLTMAVMVGTAVGVTRAVQYQMSRSSASNLQRESLATNTGTQSDEEDKLKSVPTKAREDEQLAKQIKEKLKNVPGGQKWSVYVRDLNSDRMASINADDSIEAAGLSNLFLTAPLEAKVPAYNWERRGGQKNLADCVEAMINSNDSSCVKTVSQYADLKEVNNVNASNGFKKTTVTAKAQETTAREIGDLLFRLQSSQVLSDKARRVVFDGLYGQKNRDGLPAGCDQTCLVANLTGESKNVRHDAAIVTSGNTKYVVVVMTENANWGQIADVGSTIRLLMQP